MDANHNFGSDLVAAANGDIASVSGTNETRQRVLRRLLTATGSYLWNLTYGAGVPQRVGDTLSAAVFGAIKAQILAACALEPGVMQFPEPVVVLVAGNDNSLSGNVTYVDAATKTPQVIFFPAGN